jgi:hypothetical protein
VTGERVLLIAIAYALLALGTRFFIFRALSRGALSKRRAALTTAAVSVGLLLGFVVVTGIYDALGLVWFVLAAVHFVWTYGWVAFRMSSATG